MPARLDAASVEGRKRLTGNPADHILPDLDGGGRNIDGTGIHRTESLHLVRLARIDRLLGDRISVDVQGEVGGDLARDGGHAIETEGQGSVVWSKEDIEIGGSEIRAVLTDIQSVGFDESDG